MAKYIDKFAVMAEIESYINSFCDRNGNLEDIETNGLTYETLYDLKNSIDTLEVKEVDLEKEFDNYAKDILACDVQFEPFTHLYNCAKHFFELGLKVQKGE